MWKDCDLQQTALAKKGAGILGLFPTVQVTHWMTQSKALFLWGGETGNNTHIFLPDGGGGGVVGSHWAGSRVVEVQGSLGRPKSIVTA